MSMFSLTSSDFITSPQKSEPREHNSNLNDDDVNTIIKYVKTFADNTSCHGVKKILDNQSPNNFKRWKNVSWLLVTLASLSMACHSLIQLFQDYNGHPVSTSMEREYEETTDFPSITFCNLNVAILDRFPHRSLYEQYWRDNEEYTSSRGNAYKLFYMTTIFQSISQELKKEYGHTLKDMLVDCIYTGFECSADDFYWSYDSQHGNCYSFNFGVKSDGTEQEVRQMKRVGKGRGLQLVLDIQSEKYLSFQEDSGIRLQIHQPRILPDVGNLGLIVSPGFVSSFGVTKNEISMAAPPYGVCKHVDSHGNRKQNMYASIGFAYTSHTCFKSCMQAYIMNRCGCCDISTPCNPDGYAEMFGFTLPTEGRVSYCNTSDTIPCTQWTYHYENEDRLCQEQCFPECKMVTYDFEHSISSWPNKMVASEFFQKINGRSRLANNESANSSFSSEKMYSFVKETLVKLDIHFLSRYKTIISTKPTYSWSFLLSNIGGQLGLWLGFSLLTAFEVLELVVDVVVIGVKKMFRCLISLR